MGDFVRAQHFRKIAARYEELAKLEQLPYVSDLYRTHAARYVRMAEQALREQDRSVGEAMRRVCAGGRR
jgi:hypothetical protein